jgi:prophage DNA circulation protein
VTWREDLRRVELADGRRLIGASFRGVPFLVDSGERSGGRRTVVHEFPLRDDPFVEDLGRRARSFRVDGYVIGDDYLDERDALLAALEDVAGPGELVHPNYGVKRAICASVGVRESRSEGGMASFAIEFQEAPAQGIAPVVQPDPAGVVAAAADAALAATETEFLASYDPVGLPAFALVSASTALTSLAAGLGKALAPAVRATQELAALDGQIRRLTAQASSLVRTPADVLGAFRETITGLVDTALDAPGAVLASLVEAYGSDTGPAPPASTPTRARELANLSALVGALRRIVALEAGRLAPLVPYESIEEAVATRDQVAAILEEQAATAGDTAYPALVDLRSQLLISIPGTNTFARVATVTRRVAIPSLLLSYQLYGSVAKEPDIVARNGIRHPGFVSGDLRVLTDE